jgi:hypothetical protein
MQVVACRVVPYNECIGSGISIKTNKKTNRELMKKKRVEGLSIYISSVRLESCSICFQTEIMSLHPPPNPLPLVGRSALQRTGPSKGGGLEIPSPLVGEG